MNVHANIKRERLSKGYTLEELAKKVDTTKQTIARYENGEITNIPYERLSAIAEALGCTPGYLMGWEDPGEYVSPIAQQISDLSQIAGDPKLSEMINKIRLLSDEKKEALYKYIDFLSSTGD